MDKEDVVYVCNGILLSQKKGMRVYQLQQHGGRAGTRWNESDRERQTGYEFAYTWNLKQNKTKMNKRTNRNRLLTAENKLIVARVGGIWGEEQNR